MCPDSKSNAQLHGQLESPIQQLPNELLLCVFRAGENHPRKETPFSVAVSHVSSHWRKLAINDPSLWTSIIAHSHRSVRRAETFIQRSRNCLLDVSLDWSEDRAGVESRVSQWNEATASLSLTMLIPLVHRWREFSFRADSAGLIRQLIAGTDGVFAPHLRSLRLLLYNFGMLDSQTLLGPSLLFDCPRLRTFEVDVYRFMRFPALTVCRRVAPNITILILHSSCFDLPVGEESTIHMPYLISLSLEGSERDGESALHLLKHISMPKLEHLELLSLDKLQWSLFRHTVEDHPSRGLLTLRSLTLRSCHADDGDGAWLSSAFPHLTELALIRTYPDDIMGFLITSSQSMSASPRLEHSKPVAWPKLRILNLLISEVTRHNPLQIMIQTLVSVRSDAGLPLAEVRMPKEMAIHASQQLFSSVTLGLCELGDYIAYSLRSSTCYEAEYKVFGTLRFNV